MKRMWSFPNTEASSSKRKPQNELGPKIAKKGFINKVLYQPPFTGEPYIIDQLPSEFEYDVTPIGSEPILNETAPSEAEYNCTPTGNVLCSGSRSSENNSALQNGSVHGLQLEESIQRVLALEKEQTQQNLNSLVLRFPDPPLNCDIVSKFSEHIDSTHFPQSFAPRYCFVRLKPDANVNETIDEISNIPFGTGFVTAEKKRDTCIATDGTIKTDQIDPYSLYVGNIPSNISVRKVKTHFPGCQRIDVGFPNRRKNTRYAFVQYTTVDAAMEAYKRLVNTTMEQQSLVVRFRRLKKNDTQRTENITIPIHSDVTNQRKQPDINDEDVEEKPHIDAELLQSVEQIKAEDEIKMENEKEEEEEEKQNGELLGFRYVMVKTDEEADTIENCQNSECLSLDIVPAIENSDCNSSEKWNMSSECMMSSEKLMPSSSTKQSENEISLIKSLKKPRPHLNKPRDELDDLFEQLNSEDESDTCDF